VTIYVETAIALIFVFLLLSLVTTAITELFEVLQRRRARLLDDAIGVIVSDSNVFAKLKNNALLIGSVTDKSIKDSKPSYIAPRLFAKALIGAVVDAARPDGPTTEKHELTFAEIRQSITKIENQELRTTLVSLINTTSDGYQAFEKDVSDWFDASMQRVSGKFKRLQQGRSFLIGLCLVVTLNIDAVRLTEKIMRDDELRSELLAQVELIAAGSKEFSDIQNGANGTPPCDLACVQGKTDELAAVAIGWEDAKLAPDLEDSPLHTILMMLLGWFIAAASVVPGAPFWFDLLQRFVNVRSTGQRPA